MKSNYFVTLFDLNKGKNCDGEYEEAGIFVSASNRKEAVKEAIRKANSIEKGDWILGMVPSPIIKI